MKAKKLAEELLKYPDFNVEFSHFGCLADSSIWPLYCCFKDVEVDDIGHSDKVILLGGKKDD